MKKKKVAIFLFDIDDLSGLGGAERLWGDVFENFPLNEKMFELFFLLDKPTYCTLVRGGRLKRKDNLIFIRNHKELPTEIKNYFDAINFIWKVVINRIDIIHCAYYSTHYYKRLRFLGLLPAWLRPKIVVTDVTSYTPYCYLDPAMEKEFGLRKAYLDMFFNNIKIDGIYTWYELTKKVLEEKRVVKSDPIIYAVKYCFADLKQFKPLKKRNVVIFASRLVKIKNPDWFIMAVKEIKEGHPELLEGWEFVIYGRGPYENELQKKIDSEGLIGIMRIESALNMKEPFGHSKIFVSCQDYENFTSLSMLEAMACGNAIVSRNVGQTGYFVRDGVNGFLAKTDSAHGIAEALIELLTDSSKIERMAKESIEIAEKEHTATNFVSELTGFWKKIINRSYLEQK